MEHPSLTSETTAVFERINEPRMPNRVGREDSQSDQLSDVRALDPRPTPSRGQALREDDGQGSWLLLNARKRTALHKSAE